MIVTSYRNMSPIWQVFYKFLIFWNLNQEPLGKWNSSKIWEMSKIFVNIAWGYYVKASLSLPCKIYKEGDVNKKNIFQNKVYDRICFNHIQKKHRLMLNIQVNINFQICSVIRKSNEAKLFWRNHVQCLWKQENIARTKFVKMNTSVTQRNRMNWISISVTVIWKIFQS